MFDLSPDRKRYLLQQHRQFLSASGQKDSLSKSPRRNTNQPAYGASYGPSGAAALLPRLVPQLTGEAGLIRRFSVTGWGVGSTAPPIVSGDSSDHSSGDSDLVFGNRTGKTQIEIAAEDMQPLQPQSTGGWNSWWVSSGGEKANASNKETVQTAKSYVDGLRSSKTTDIKLVKHLISLRVHLSTAKLHWIEEFAGEEKGLRALSELLATLVGNGGKRKNLNDVQTTVVLCLLKCLRVLLNTEVSRDTSHLPLPTYRCFIAWI